uniref:Uncharacterized protein n=1 Tax=Graphocephala atropunctata TaxID=36148 RepID=A0A1B6M9R9_9HEMI
MGMRNEEARARRRRMLKEELSLTSVPDSEQENTATARPSRSQNPTLSNHFLWTVVERSQVGDGSFPHLTRYHEKPDIHGRDFEKVTYVLHMGKGTEIEKESLAKETQTSFITGISKTVTWPSDKRTSLVEVQEEVVPREEFEGSKEEKPFEESVKRSKSEEMMKRRRERTPGKLIRDFYCKPKDRSRSPKKPSIRSGGSDSENNVQQIIDTTEKETTERVKTEAEKRRGNKQDRWKLRAGAENVFVALRESQMLNSKSKIIKSETRKFHEIRNRRCGSTESLLKTASGSNRYLYVSNRSKRRLVKDSEEN